MKRSYFQTSLAVLAMAAMTACGGGGGSAPVVPAAQGAHTERSSILSRIVGLGDSLTAGYQSQGFLGATGVKNPLYPGQQVPPNQENGWWTLLDEQASGKPLDQAVAQEYDPSVSPLPLIKGPGLNNQIVPWNNPFFPFGLLKNGDVCTDNNGFNQDAYRFGTWPRVRMNSKSTTIRNLGIPGITMHEANTMTQPQTNTCKALPGIPGLLNMVVADESGVYWPVLGNFAHLEPKLTMVNAAASLHPTLATVWLGANDVLKYMGSGGRFHGGDNSAAQAADDLRGTINAMRQAGAKVVAANLPNVLETGYFQRVTIAPNQKACAIRTYLSCLFSFAGLPNSVITYIAKKYGLATPNGCLPASVDKPCGYVTLAGAIEIIQYFGLSGQIPDLDCANPAPHCKAVPGSGLGGNYITPEFAGKVQSLNDAINQGIDDAATQTRTPLVDVQAIFHGIASGNPNNPYFRAAASINPGVCCTLGYLYGMLSFDGLHPSNTGYALIAYDFIATINKAYGTHIPEVDVTAAYGGTRCSNPKYCFPDPYAPPNDIP